MIAAWSINDEPDSRPSTSLTYEYLETRRGLRTHARPEFDARKRPMTEVEIENDVEVTLSELDRSNSASGFHIMTLRN